MSLRRLATAARHAGVPMRFAGSLKSLSTDELTLEPAASGKVWSVLLNRPKGLNALTSSMIRTLHPYYSAWAGYEESDTPAPRIVILEGAGGKAFCAGGDVVVLAGRDLEGPRRFFFEEYLVDYATYAMGKRGVTQVALWAGIVMGGGVGISVHAPVRVATEKTLFALPETGIGLFPDVGTSIVLANLPHDGLGAYLGLTGARLKGADAYHAGFATHYIPTDALSDLKSALYNHAKADDFPTDSAAAVKSVGDVVRRAAEESGAPPSFTMDAKLPLIAKFFGKSAPKAADGVGLCPMQLIKRLELAASDDEDSGSELAAFAEDAAKKIRSACPASVAVTARLLGLAEDFKSREQAFAVDYILSQRVVVKKTFGGNFQEGVRALLIDKDGEPAWSPPRLEEVEPTKVKECFDGKGITQWTPKAGLDSTLL